MVRDFIKSHWTTVLGSLAAVVVALPGAVLDIIALIERFGIGDVLVGGVIGLLVTVVFVQAVIIRLGS